YGFRVIAWESERVRTRKLDDYVRSCAGSASEAVKQLHEYWADEQTRDFARWLCEWNRAHPLDLVHVYGIDVQDPAADRAELRQLLSRTQEVPGSWQKRKTWSPLASHLGALAICERGHDDLCRVALRDFERTLDEQARSAHALESTAVIGAARIALTSYSAWQARASIADEARAFEARALGMASVFLQLKSRYFPHRRSILWAHNIHVVKRHSAVRWTWLGTPIETLGTRLENASSWAPRALKSWFQPSTTMGSCIWSGRRAQNCCDRTTSSTPQLAGEAPRAGKHRCRPNAQWSERRGSPA
ncbi:MAG TPA: erythromycin esterase family protein, partial [Polyangiaceae bacterium]|nr:erythromycin esterase family protein [Polyangiaceae bacterium]